MLQVCAACVLVVLAQTFKSDATIPNWTSGLWLGVFLLWWVQHYFFRMMLRRRASRAESQYDMLPESVYPALTQAMTPHWMDASFQAVALFLLMDWYFSTWSHFLPSHMVSYAWALGLVPLWLLQNQFLRLILVERGRNAYYRRMYEILAKT